LIGNFRKESLEIIESDDDRGEETPVYDAGMLQWFDEEGEASPIDILDTIKLRIKEVKKFQTPHALKTFTKLTAIMQYVKLHEHYKCNNCCSRP